MNRHRLDIPEARRVGLPALILGVVAGLACVAAGWAFPATFFPAYLVGYLFVLGIALGSMAVSMIHHLSGGGWGVPIRRILESAYSPLPLLAVLFLPLVLGMRVLYPWMDAEHVAHDEILLKKAAYLNETWFLIRSAIYFAIWILLGLALNLLSRGDDPAGEAVRQRRLALLSGPGLILWVLSVTFASVDWVMSLEPHWFSSMYGVLHIAGSGVSGLAFAIVAVVALRERPPWTETLLLARLNDLGNFLLAFTMFWAYVAFMQYLIIWSGNLPEDTPWYLARGRGGWQYVAIALMALHFVVPFLLLLSRETKRSPRRLVGVAVLLIAMRLVDLYWLVIPAMSPGQFTLNWLVLLTPLAVGGLWLAAACWRLPARAAWPVYELPVHEETGDEFAPHAAH